MQKINKPTVIILLYPGCVFFEIALAIELLAEKYEIIFATPDGFDHQASNGSIIRVATSYNKLDLSNCRAVLVPGGDPGSIKDNKEIDEVIQAANRNGLWLAAICAGPSILAKAGVLWGKKIAHGYGPAQLEFLKNYFEGVHLIDEKFMCDSNVITAKAEAHIDFAVEIACRLGAVDASKANRVKDYYRGVLGRKIRPLALAIIQNAQGQFLFHKGHDKVKGEHFYRPLGGGIEFSESGKLAIEREIMEEINQDVTVHSLIKSFENIFTFEGHQGHEIIMLYAADFKNKNVYQQQELDIYESGVAIGKAVWKSVTEIRAEGANLYPTGLEEVMNVR